MTEIAALRALATDGFAGLRPDRFIDAAEWCNDWCRESADPRYCLLGDALRSLATWWDEHDKYGGVPVSLAAQIELAITSSLSAVLDANTAQLGVRLAADMRDQIRHLLLDVRDWETAGYVRTSSQDTQAMATKTTTANLLVQVEAVQFRTDPFFRFTSGALSPIYVDNRKLLGFVSERTAVVHSLLGSIKRLATSNGIDAIAGTATAGIPWAACIADRMKLPMMYVRSAARSWGNERAVEGEPIAGQRVILVEDLSYSAGSLTQAAEQLRTLGLVVEHCVAILSYETQAAAATLQRSGLTLVPLTTIDAALEAAHSRGAIDTSVVDRVNEWLTEAR